jgi:hypothetical protein
MVGAPESEAVDFVQVVGFSLLSVYCGNSGVAKVPATHIPARRLSIGKAKALRKLRHPSRSDHLRSFEGHLFAFDLYVISILGHPTGLHSVRMCLLI